MEARSEGHKHGVNIYLAKEWCRRGDGGWDADLHSLAKLALVTSVDIPFYIAVERWPPKAVKESAACGVESLVAKTIMGIVDEGEAEGRHDA